MIKNALKVAVVTGVFPVVSETFVVTHVKGLIASNQTVDFYCLRLINVLNMRENALNPKAKLLSKKEVLKNKTNSFKAILKGFSINLLLPILKSFNLFKYGIDAINGNQLLKTYYNYFFNFHSYNIVHVHFGDNAVEILPLLKKFKGKIIVTFHGYDAHKYDIKFYQHLKALKNIRYVVNTKYTKDKILELGFDSNKTSIVPVPVSEMFLNTKRTIYKNNARFHILFVGRFVPFKAPLLAIKIFEKVLQANTNVHFNMIGNGSEFEICRQYINSNKLESHITLLGASSHESIKTYMSKSQLLLMPGILDKNGRCENQGLVIQEAQAMRLPVLVSDVGGMKDGLIDGVTGFVLPEKDIDAFVNKILYLISDNNILTEMGEKARNFILKNYDNKGLINKLLKIYNNA